MSTNEVDRVIRRIKAAKEYAKKTMDDSNSSELQKEDAESLIWSIDELINGMCNYTRAVFQDNFKNESRIQMIENAKSREEYQRECENIELTRKRAHDDLISKIKITDMICRDCGVEEIYGKLPKEYKENVDGLMGSENRSRPGVVETRHAIADWTWNFVLGCTVAMVMEDYFEIDYNKNADDKGRVDSVYRNMARSGEDKKTIELILDEK